MNTIRFALIVMFALLGGCELAGTGGDDEINTGSGGAVSGQVEGRAVKGVLGGAVIQAYAMESGGLRWLAETTTDAQGYYSLALSGIRGPVLLEVSPAADATMRCDSVSGCGDAVFGDDVPLREDFRLTTMVLPAEIDNKQTAITPLTHIAAQWSRELGEVPTADMVRLARSRVAGVLSVTPGFAFSNVPDITDEQEMASSDASAVGNAVMVAAFQEAAAHWGDSFLGDLSYRFNAHGGQLPRVAAGASLKNLVDAAVTIARGVNGNDALKTIASSLEYQRDHMSAGITTFQEPLLDRESPGFIAARDTVRGIAAGLERFGINEDAAFAGMRAEEMAWMMNSGTLDLYQRVSEVVAYTYLMSLLGDLVPGPDTLYIMEGITFERRYLENRGILMIRTSDLSGSTDIRVEMPLARQVLADTRVLEFAMSGNLSSGSMGMTIDASVSVDPLDTEVMPMIIALDTMMIAGNVSTWEDYAQEAEKALDNLHGRADIAGTMELENRDAMRTASGSVRMSMELDHRNLDGQPNILDIEVQQARLDDPYGRLLQQQSGYPFMSLHIGTDVALSASADLTDKGERVLGYRWSALMENAGDIVRGGTGLIVPIAAAFGPASSSASLALEFPLRSETYRFDMANGAITVSRPNSVETAFEMRNLSAGKGILYRDNDVVGTLSVDSDNNRVCFLLLDGSSECMGLGTNEELAALPERQIVQSLVVQ